MDKHLSGQTVGLEKSLVHFEQEDGQLRRADPKDKETNGLWHVSELRAKRQVLLAESLGAELMTGDGNLSK